MSECGAPTRVGIELGDGARFGRRIAGYGGWLQTGNSTEPSMDARDISQRVHSASAARPRSRCSAFRQEQRGWCLITIGATKLRKGTRVRARKPQKMRLLD
jgi:hypothetical protein